MEYGFGMVYQYEDELYITSKGKDQHYPYILSTLTSIDISNNQLNGEIPSNFGMLKGLRLLNLSMNNLTGSIPTSLGAMTQLDSLDLSTNSISGKIPMELDSLNYLGTLKLSNNNLSGIIPEGQKLITFKEESYTGNPNLWGCPLPKNCSWPQFASPPSTSSSKQEKSMKIPWYEITVGLSWGASFGVTWSLLVVNKRWKDKYFQKVDVVLQFFFPWLNNWTL
uniref:Leucine-rich repeat-containing N-terminal plant-type domain-containing protein n=1 Tax=Araucaria cunninghamii TaxID=56994 RepID=A0A0D6R813_ARACU